jgi:hypothetical protein
VLVGDARSAGSERELDEGRCRSVGAGRWTAVPSVGGGRSVGGGGNGGEGKIWEMGGNFGNESETSTTRIFNFFSVKK